MRLMIRALRVLLIVALVAAAGYAFRGKLLSIFFGTQSPPDTQSGLNLGEVQQSDVTVVAEEFDVPWAFAFLPDRSLLVTERPGRLVHIVDGAKRSYEVNGVREAGEGGLMGLAIHPDFEQNHFIFLCLTAESRDGLENRVERWRFDRGLSQRTVLIDGIDGANFHNGCRLDFGPDGYLYITTGDAGTRQSAQQRSSLSGKILRLTADGDVPEDNPFESPIYSYGHRNPQGLTWDDQGRLWSTEHGRSGAGSGYDELNLVEAGKNYGWPVIQGDASAPDMVTPVLHSGPDYTWAPSGMAYWNGRIFFGGLRGEALYEARSLEPGAAQLRAHFHSEFGRIRAVRMGPDGLLYFGTSNRDHRGRLRGNDDKILRIDPAAFD